MLELWLLSASQMETDPTKDAGVSRIRGQFLEFETFVAFL